MPDERYERVRTLGEGGMGTVELVYDHERGEHVAQKRMRSMTPAALLRFKREFRAMERLLHPGLVRLYELGEDTEGPYFTMEYVEGGDLGRYCAGLVGTSSNGATLDATIDAAHAPTLSGAVVHATRSERVAVDLGRALPRLLHALPQLVEALSFLHGREIVHRDLKPANVLVDPRGVLKLVDFGVLAPLRESIGGDAAGVVGTIGFMAPEQIRGAEAAPPSDLYALGAMIFVLLSGRAVFEGAPMQQLLAHVEHEPPRLDAIVPGAPPALVELCAALLAKDPAARPGLAWVGRCLERAGARPAILARPEPARTELVGRERERRALASLLAREGSAPVLTIVRGASGMGKSALAAWVAEEAAHRGAIVLSGRGRVNDRLPFNAVDGAIDQLAMALGRERRHPDDVRRAMGRAAVAFPVLAELAEPEPVGARVAVFDALLRLLEHAGRAGGLLIALDDLQWADADSIALIRHLVRAAPSQIQLLATMRDDEPLREATALEREASLVIELGALDDDVLARLVRDAASGAGADPSEEAVEAAVVAARGRPFLAELAGRALARSAGSVTDPLEPVVRDAVERDGPLLAAIVAADGWASVGALVSLVGATAGALEERVRDLAAAGVVRRAGPLGVAGAVDLYHDVMRAALARALPPASLREAHDGFVRLSSTGALGAMPPQRLVRHLLAAERFAEAGRAARAAAEAAEKQLAFALAADMYEVAIEHGAADDLDLRRRQALALERCARYVRAAERWEALAARGTSQDALHCAMNAAHALLAANRVEEGVRRLDEALAVAGDPPVAAGGLGRWGAVLRFLAGPARVAPRPVAAPERALARAECDRKLGTMVGYFDPYAGVRMLTRARHGYARLGAFEELAACDYLFAAFAEHGSAARTTPRLARQYRAAADAVRAAHAPEDPRLRGMSSFLDASVHLREGRWDDAARDFDACIAGLAEAGDRGVFEQIYALSQIAFIAFTRHDVAGLESVLRRYELESDVHESAVLSHRQLYAVALATLRGRFAEAGEAMESVRAALPESLPSVQRAVAVIVARYPELYDPAGQPLPLDPAEAALVDRFRILKINCAAFYAGCLALTEASALRRGDRRASRHRLARYAAIARRAPPCAGGDAERALAYGEDQRGRPEAAIALLERAEAVALASGRPTAAAIARYQRGARLGGDEGAALRREAEDEVARAGLALAMLAEDPGLR